MDCYAGLAHGAKLQQINGNARRLDIHLPPCSACQQSNSVLLAENHETMRWSLLVVLHGVLPPNKAIEFAHE